MSLENANKKDNLIFDIKTLCKNSIKKFMCDPTLYLCAEWPLLPYKQAFYTPAPQWLNTNIFQFQPSKLIFTKLQLGDWLLLILYYVMTSFVCKTDQSKIQDNALSGWLLPNKNFGNENLSIMHTNVDVVFCFQLHYG